MKAVDAKKHSESYRSDGCIEQIIFDIKNYTRGCGDEFMVSEREIGMIHLMALTEKGYRVEKLDRTPTSYMISWSHCDTSDLDENIVF